MVKANRKVKDRLFRILFREKKELLSLYNAVNGTSYEDPEALEINTLEDAVFIGMKNDVSFIIGDIMSVYEHQSTLNPNIPLRGLLYVTDLYRGYLEQHAFSVHQSAQIKLPCPQFLVFYNGMKKMPDRFLMKLSEAFSEIQEKDDACLEFSATFLNVNIGHNKELLAKCRRLEEYSLFIAKIREKMEEGLTFKQAVDFAVDACIKEGILADLLRKNRGEVQQAVWYDFDEEKYLKDEKEFSRQSGFREGLREGLRAYLSVCREMGLTDKQIIKRVMEQFSLNEKEVRQYVETGEEIPVLEENLGSMWHDFDEEKYIKNEKELSQ